MPPANPETSESRFNLTDMTSALLLAATGGLLDAIVYLDHGQVFANAMTGNVIFLGIALIQRDWAQSLRHIAPLVAFLCGVVAARIIRAAPLRRSTQLVLAIEAAALFVVGLLPAGFPQLAFTAIVAFVSAFQVATFRRVGRFTYNSTFVTGNLRMVAEGLFDRYFAADIDSRSAGKAQFLKLSGICASFLVGACAGAFVAPRFPIHAILFAEIPLSITLLLVFRSQDPTPPSR
jgi:uncharacterized membrane protein YoaK (UPF0700 family)